MNVYIYNGSLLVGVALVSVGVGMISLAGALVAAGILVLGLTVWNQIYATRES